MNTDVEMANDEGADPTDDIKKQNPGQATTLSDAHAKKGSDADPKKVQNLAKAGRPDFNPDAGSD